MDPETVQLSLLVPRNLVKALKDALETHSQLNKNTKIKANTMAHPTRQRADTTTLSQSQGNSETPTRLEMNTYVVPTTLSVGHASSPDELEWIKTGLLKEIGMASYEDAIRTTTTHITTTPPSQPKPTALTISLRSWLTHDLPPPLLSSLDTSIPTLLAAFPTRYTIYPPLLLLPSSAFTTPPWPTLLAALPSAHHLDHLYRRLCTNLHVTHVAISAPIPAHVPGPSPLPPDHASGIALTDTANVLRAPTNLRPLHGDFGPSPSPLHHPSSPTPAALAAAFWVSTRQSAIYQTWAPLHTMFSRGNVSEKARVLRFAAAPPPPSCSDEPERRRWGGKCTAVDLYAGIGYFAFSYAKSECVGRVLGWEVSGWSVEGLRRGAGRNAWGVRVVGGSGVGVEGEGEGEGDDGWADGEERIVVFREDNINALRRVEAVREKLPPVKHVNCGLLPTSRRSWPVAVGVLDPVEGGWIHAHENIAVKELGSTRDEIVGVFTELVDDDRRKVECQHLEQVKTYAPGIMHCVLDIYIPPAPSLTGAATATGTPTSPPARADYNTAQST